MQKPALICSLQKQLFSSNTRSRRGHQLTFGDFLSVFLLTRTGLSYFTSEEFGGIILLCLQLNIQRKRLFLVLNLSIYQPKSRKTCVTLEMNRGQYQDLGRTHSQSIGRSCVKFTSHCLATCSLTKIRDWIWTGLVNLGIKN